MSKKWKILTISLIAVVLFLVLLPKNNYSYDVGYDLGISGAIGQTLDGTASGTASAACKFILTIGRESTTTDGIPWADLVEKDYLEGCLEGTRQAYPGADWIK